MCVCVFGKKTRRGVWPTGGGGEKHRWDDITTSKKKKVCRLRASILSAINVLRKHFVAIDVSIPEAVL